MILDLSNMLYLNLVEKKSEQVELAVLNKSYIECVNECMNTARCKCGLIHEVYELADRP